MTTDLDLSTAVARVTEETPVEEAIALADRIDSVSARLREMKAQLVRDYIAPALKSRGGSVMIGDVKRYMGHDKVTDCIDAVGAAESFVAETGDLSALFACLAAQAFKPAALAKVAPKTHATFFVTRVRDTLKGGEPAPLKLQAVDSRYVTGGVE